MNIRNQCGWTALMCAVWQNEGKCVELLIEAGAALNIQDTDGNTALGLAALYFLAEKFVSRLILAGTANLQVSYGGRFVAENQNLFVCCRREKSCEEIQRTRIRVTCQSSVSHCNQKTSAADEQHESVRQSI